MDDVAAAAGRPAPGPSPDQAEDGAGRASSRADLVSGAVWMLLGAALAAASWRMDRLGVGLAAAPGLVPGLLGGAIFLLGGLLLARALGAGRPRAPAPGPAGGGIDGRRLLLAAALGVAYAGGLLGRGLPFWLGSAAFAFVTGLTFDWRARRARGRVVRGVAVALGIAVGSALLITVLFQEVFLVRLP